MTRTEYIEAIALRDAIPRAAMPSLPDDCDGCVTLTASGPAPLGLNQPAIRNLPCPRRCCGVPALSLPLLQDGGLPLGLQLIGFADRDEEFVCSGQLPQSHVLGRA